MDGPGTALARVEEARRLLAEARTVEEVKDIRDKAEAARQYARTARLSIDVQNYAAEIKLRAERKAGELLREMPKQAGARTDRLSGHGEILPTLSDIGITHKQSSRWQQVAEIPEETFEQAIADTKALAAAYVEQGSSPPPEAHLTTAGITRFAQADQARKEAADVQFVLEAAPDDGGRLALATVKAAYARGVLAVHRLRELDPSDIADALRDGDLRSAQWFIRDTRAWLDRFEAALGRGLRVITAEVH